MRKFFIFLFLFFSILALCQRPHYKQFSTNDGLPSNEIYTIKQDKIGYLWLGTENGISRFNGYHFENFGFDAGLEQLEINQIHEDKSGTLWFGSLSGKLYYFQNNRFHPFIHNNVLAAIFQKNGYILNFEYIDNQDFIFSLKKQIGESIIIINSISGKTREISDTDFNDNCYFLNGNTIKGQFSKLFRIVGKDKMSVEKIIVKRNISDETLRINASYKKIFYLSHINHEYVLIGDNEIINVNKDGKENKVALPNAINKVVEFGNSIYLLGKSKLGVRKYDSIQDLIEDKSSDTYLENLEISDLIKDKNGGIWISSIRGGLYYIQNERIKIYSEVTNSNNLVTSIFPMDENNCLGIIADRHLVKVSSDKLTNLISFDFFLQSPKLLGNVFYTANGEYNIINDDIFIRKNYINSISYSVIENEDQLTIVGTGNSINIRNNSDTPFKKLEKPLITKGRILCILKHTKNNNRWIGTTSGLQVLKNNKIEDLKIQNSDILSRRINCMAYSSDNLLLLGTKGAGIAIFDEDKMMIHDTINQEDGLTDQIINDLYTSENELYIATPSGLFIYNFTNKNMIKVDQSDGLPSSFIYKVKGYNNVLWLGTSMGIVKYFKTNKIHTIPSKPILSKFSINGRIIHNTRDFIKLKHSENNLNLEFLNFDFSLGDRVLYKYSLNDQPYSSINGNTIELFDLPPNNYKVNVIAYDKQNNPSQATSIIIKISKPWWKSNYLKFLFLIILSFFTFLVLRSIDKRRNEKVRIQNQILELEKQALLSQMKPHFIFNAISSIQYLIQKSELEKAELLLGQFSQLIRKILDFSKNKTIPLSEEIKLLKLYTQIELERFENQFELKWEIDENIDKDHMMIPTMLVQPLIENAINHGVFSLPKNTGIIKIVIKALIKGIKIEVMDNGPGLNPQKVKSTNHKSIALTNIKERVKNYNEIGEYNMEFSVTNRTETSGVISRLTIEYND